MAGDSAGLAERLIAALRDLDGTTAYVAILVLLGLCGLGLPMPEDIILITAGFLASMGKFSPVSAVLAGMVGVLSGDALLFFVGRRFGPAVFRWRLVRALISPEQQARAQARILENGSFICFIARFLPGLRSPIYLIAGTMGIEPRTYLVLDFTAAAISVPFWVGFGWYFGDKIESGLALAARFQWVTLAVAALVVGLYVGWRRWRSREGAG
jgi:membrane protein DedA with SNARE-associated domain